MISGGDQGQLMTKAGSGRSTHIQLQVKKGQMISGRDQGQLMTKAGSGISTQT